MSFSFTMTHRTSPAIPAASKNGRVVRFCEGVPPTERSTGINEISGGTVDEMADKKPGSSGHPQPASARNLSASWHPQPASARNLSASWYPQATSIYNRAEEHAT